MASAIDITKPVYGNPTTQSVRDNFTYASNEITDLQDKTAQAPFLPISGGTMNGVITLYNDPLNPSEAATKRYVDNAVVAGGGGGGGIIDAPVDGMFYARGGAITTNNFNDWSSSPLFTQLKIGPDKDTTYFGLRSDTTYNFYDLANDGANLLRYDRTTKNLRVLLNGNAIADFNDTGIALNRFVTLSADPTNALHAVTKQYVDAKPGGAVIADVAPVASPGVLWWDSVAGQLYVRYNDGTSTQWVPATNVEGLANTATKAEVTAAYSNVGRNLIHNSMFNIQQRGAGPWTNIQLTADRWGQDFFNGTLSTSIVALSDANRVTIGDEAAQSTLRYVVVGSATAGSYTETFQGIENVRRLAGKTVTVSFWAFAAAGTPKLGLSLDQYFGTGGSPSASVPGVGQSVTLSVTPTRYTLTYTLASVAGKVYGTNNDNCTYMNIWFSGATDRNTITGSVGVQSGTFSLWGMQLEIGTALTPLEKLDPVMQLQQCQRFYQTSQFNLQAYGAAGAGVVSNQPFPVRMRATPTITTSGVTQTNGVGSTPATPDFIQIAITATVAGMAIFAGSYTASAEL